MKIEIFGKPSCAACDSAKMLANTLNAEVVYKTLDVDYTIDELMERYRFIRSFPQIWVDDEHIGGFDNFKAYVENVK